MTYDPDSNITMPQGTERSVSDWLKAQKIQIDEVYTEGVCGDGAAILKDGARMTILEILSELNEYAWIKHCADLAKKRRA